MAGKYKKAWLSKCRDMAEKGYTDAQMAEELGVCRKTLYNICRDRPSLKRAIEEGKAIADDAVEDSLYQRATGYDYEETQTEISQTGGAERKVVKRSKRHVPPDTAAAFIWLKNRRPNDWRDKKEMAVDNTHSFAEPPKIIFTDEDDEA